MNRFSYKNVYNSEKHKNFMDGQLYVIDDRFLDETEIYELPDGFSVEWKIYIDNEHRTEVQKITLRNSDKVIYEYCCFYGHNFVFKDIIHHRNGHRYYPFHVDLYGISYLDVDTLEVYHYIPEGFEHNEEYRCGESFIITDIDYDRESNLIAYGGCYWAFPYDVMVGDFSEPLNFNPHLVNMHGILDPKSDFCDDIDFKEWKDNRLYVLCDNGEEKSLSAEELKLMINELTGKGKTL